MSQQEILLKIFEFAILVFSLSLHEASHAWMASRLGDPTARMLGRVTLNPMKHIDPIGTILIPLAMLFLPGFGQFLIGWAKPTPVTTRNFKHITRDDILTTLAGPGSNVLASFVALIALIVLTKTSAAGALARVQDPLHLQRDDRLADGAAGDAVPRGHLGLRRQARTGRIDRPHDLLAQVIGDLAVLHDHVRRSGVRRGRAGPGPVRAKADYTAFGTYAHLPRRDPSPPPVGRARHW